MKPRTKNRKFTQAELKQIKSKKYLHWRHTLEELREGPGSGYARFTLSDSLVSDHHAVVIRPVTTGGKPGLVVELSFTDGDVAERYSAIGAPCVAFPFEGTVREAVAMAESLAKTQNDLLWRMPEGTRRIKG